MSKLIPFFEVGTDPQDKGQFCLLSLSGARQFREVLDTAIKVFSDGLMDKPEGPDDICKIETRCGKVHVVFMTDDTLDKIMGVTTSMLGLPKDYQPWENQDGTPWDDKKNSIPDWLNNLGLAINGDGLVSPSDGPSRPDNDPED